MAGGVKRNFGEDVVEQDNSEALRTPDSLENPTPKKHRVNEDEQPSSALLTTGGLSNSSPSRSDVDQETPPIQQDPDAKGARNETPTDEDECAQHHNHTQEGSSNIATNGNTISSNTITNNNQPRTSDPARNVLVSTNLPDSGTTPQEDSVSFNTNATNSISTSTLRQSSPNAPHFPPVGPSLGAGARTAVEENRTTLWIGDLERWEDEEYIFHFFNQICPRSVVSVKIARDREQQRSLGYGFIDFLTREIAEQILSSAPALKRPHGRRFKLTWARGKTRQPFNPTTPAVAAPLVIPTSNTIGVGNKPQVASPQTFMTVPTPRWCVDLPNPGSYCNTQRLRDHVLKPLTIENVSTVETLANNENSFRINFSTSASFFAFIGRYQDGCIDLCGKYIPYTVPNDVMDRWTRMYEQSVEAPRSAPAPTPGNTSGPPGGTHTFSHSPPVLGSLAWQRPYGV